jgi:quercetin dioxygenase-like cupin family protein
LARFPPAPERLKIEGMLLQALDTPFAVVEHRVPEGAMTPLHFHDEDESVRVVDGAVTVHLLDGVVRLEPGESLVVPAATPHVLVAEEDAHLLSGTATRAAGRYEDFLRAVAIPGEGATEDETATVAVIAASCGTTLLGPPGTLP